MSNAQNVSSGNPEIKGAISVAPRGTVLPTDAMSELNEAFKNLGYVSDAGVVNSNSATPVEAWGGDVVNNSKKETFKYTLIECLNLEVLKSVYGPNNVTGTLETGITVKVNDDTQEPCAVVIDMILKGGVLKRIVIPSASVSSVGDVTYANSNVIGYETTVNAAKDASGNSHYEYIKAPTQAVDGEANSVNQG